MSHYAESALCQKLQNRRVIPKSYLNAIKYISSDTQRLKSWKEVLFDQLINCNRPTHIVYSDFKL